MLMLPPERSLTKSANLAAASPHGPVGPTTKLALYSGLYVAASAGPANPTATASTIIPIVTRRMVLPPSRFLPSISDLEKPFPRTHAMGCQTDCGTESLITIGAMSRKAWRRRLPAVVIGPAEPAQADVQPGP